MIVTIAAPEENEKSKVGLVISWDLSHCPKCNQLSVLHLDGCDTCLECGYSNCEQTVKEAQDH